MTRDLRRYARQTNLRLLVGFLLLLFLVGSGLIYLIFGPEATFLGLICMVSGLMPLVLIFLALVLIEWLVKNSQEK